MTALSRQSVRASKQQGAALVIGLILLLVLTILAVSGVVTSTLQLRMVGNQQQQERAFQAAEVGIEDALTSPILSTTTADVQPLTETPHSSDDQYRYRLEFAGEASVGPGLTGYSVGAGLTSYHFTVDSTGLSTGGAESRHVQGFYIIGPGGN
jgi:uncharacterized iron-regulated membrane protein